MTGRGIQLVPHTTTEQPDALALPTLDASAGHQRHRAIGCESVSFVLSGEPSELIDFLSRSSARYQLLRTGDAAFQ